MGLLEEMRRNHGLGAASLRGCSAAISACAKAGKWSSALELLREMERLEAMQQEGYNEDQAIDYGDEEVQEEAQE